MITKTALAKKVMASIETGNMKEVAADLSGDFVFTGMVSRPMNKSQFLEFMQALMTAFPGWKYYMSGIHEEGDVVKMKFHAMGVNAGTINIPSLGLKSVPATGKPVVLPVELAEFTVKDDKIAEFKISVVPGGGIAGILKQLGIEQPAEV